MKIACWNCRERFAVTKGKRPELPKFAKVAGCCEWYDPDWNRCPRCGVLVNIEAGKLRANRSA